MKPSVKIFAMLSLSAAVGDKMVKVCKSKDKIDAGRKLHDAGCLAAKLYPYTALSPKKVDDIGKSVEALICVPMTPPEILSILLAGLIDIRAKCNPGRHATLDPVIDNAQLCVDLYDDDIDHELAYERYIEWVS